MKRKLMTITLSLRKYTTKLIGNTIKMQYIGKNYSELNDQGLQFWQTKSFSIITNDIAPGDCSHRVISQNGDRELFERLATPRPAPKVTLRSNWFVQQQQQTIRNEDVATRESRAGTRDETRDVTRAEKA